jgi:hypothetical protein
VIQEVSELSTSLNLRFQPSLGENIPRQKTTVRRAFKMNSKKNKLLLKLKLKKAPLFSRVF